MSDAGTSAGAAGTGTGTAAAGTATVDTSWFNNFDDETTGHIQNRGWDKLPARDVIAQAVKAHREAEKHIGIPADQILRMPKDAADAEGWAKLRERIGVPKEAKDYDFTGLKFADGTELDDAFVERVRGIAHSHHLSKDGAKGLAADLVKMIEADESSESAAYQTQLDAEKAKLQTDWGNTNFNANMIIARNAAAKLGVDEAAVSALEKSIGYAAVMKMFHTIGTKMGEDRFVTNGMPGSGGVLTKEQAVAELKNLQADQQWVSKFMKGDAEARRQFDNLTSLVAGA